MGDDHDDGGHGHHDRPRIVIDPASYSGQPTITWRIPSEIPCSAYWNGWSVETVQRNWPAITRPRLLVAAWYLGKHGTRTWRKRWGAWAEEVRVYLISQTYDDAPNPPQEGVSSE